MKDNINFRNKLSLLYKKLHVRLSGEFDFILNPRNPYIIENANILISSYKQNILILYLTKKELLDFEYLLYRIYLLKLSYPLESNIIIYTDGITDIKYINKLEYINQIRVIEKETELFNFIKSRNGFNILNDDEKYHLQKIKRENFYRANLIFL